MEAKQEAKDAALADETHMAVRFDLQKVLNGPQC